MLEAVLEDEECGDAIGSDERSIANAAFASSALLHEDLDYSPVCDWLESGTGNPTPSASSTLWLVEIRGDVDSEDRQRYANDIRSMLGEQSILEYGVISDDLISNDINESTLDNLVWLILLAVIVVSVPCTYLQIRYYGCGAADRIAGFLVWTYGAISLMGMKFSILEIAVAPLFSA